MFSSHQILPPDDKIMRLYSDIKQIIDIFSPSNYDEKNQTIPDDDALILITAVVTSCIRGLKYCKTKLHCLEILQQLSMYTTSETVLDRILPYIVSNSFEIVNLRWRLLLLVCFLFKYEYFSYTYAMILQPEFGSVHLIR